MADLDETRTIDPDRQVPAARGAYSPPLDRLDRGWLHLIEPGETDPTETAEPPHPDARTIGLAVAIDAFIEAFDAHDVDGVLDCLGAEAELPGLGGDADGLVTTLCRCWDERPNAVLTRGLLRDGVGERSSAPVAVLWDVDDEGWRRVGLLTFELADDGEGIGQIEFAGDVPVVEEAEAEPPDEDPPEGARWSEWDEGA